MSLLQRYNSENHYVIISHIHIISLYSHRRPTPVSRAPQPPARPDEIMLLCTECKTPYSFFFLYFIVYLTRNECKYTELIMRVCYSAQNIYCCMLRLLLLSTDNNVFLIGDRRRDVFPTTITYLLRTFPFTEINATCNSS